MSMSISSFQNSAGPRTIADYAWSTPNARSTSFLVDSWALAKCFLLFPCGDEIVLTNVTHCKYMPQQGPKKACHIQRSYKATAFKIIVGSWKWLEYIHYHEAGQFFHCQCMQSMLPNMSENPRFLPSASNLAMCSLLGDLKYSFEKTEITAWTNLLRLLRTMASPIFKYSSIKSTVTSFASILSAAVIFWMEVKPSLLEPTLLWTKYKSWASTAYWIWQKRSPFIWNLLQKYLWGYIGGSAK